MSLTLHHDPEQGLTLDIPDRKGNLVPYPVRLRRPPGGRYWSLTVGDYEVSRYQNTWVCTCPAWRYGTRRPCKHCLVAKGLERLLLEMTETSVRTGT
jgi:hypothetical protein